MARLITAVTALLTLTLGLGVHEAGAADFHTCPAKGAGQVRVAIVVDARALGGAQSVVCVVVASGSNGLTALRARATRIGTSPPRIGSSGLVCAIDDVPAAPACG